MVTVNSMFSFYLLLCNFVVFEYYVEDIVNISKGVEKMNAVNDDLVDGGMWVFWICCVVV